MKVGNKGTRIKETGQMGMPFTVRTVEERA
jgi:hypothetical protein